MNFSAYDRLEHEKLDGAVRIRGMVGAGSVGGGAEKYLTRNSLRSNEIC